MGYAETRVPMYLYFANKRIFLFQFVNGKLVLMVNLGQPLALSLRLGSLQCPDLFLVHCGTSGVSPVFSSEWMRCVSATGCWCWRKAKSWSLTSQLTYSPRKESSIRWPRTLALCDGCHDRSLGRVPLSGLEALLELGGAGLTAAGGWVFVISPPSYGLSLYNQTSLH